MDYTFLIMLSFVMFDFVGMMVFRRVPILLYLIGLFSVVTGIYAVVAGFGAASQVYEMFGLFCLVVGVFTMLVPALGIRVLRDI